MDHSAFHRAFLFRAVAIVGSGGFIFGYDIGVISGTLDSLKDEFHLNSLEVGLVVSILYAGSILGSIVGGPLCDALGRWKTIHIQNAIFILGAALTGLANNLPLLLVGRFCVGIASAISGLADVPYLTEISPAAYRGVISGQYEVLVGTGILVSFLLDLAFSTFHNGWRIAFLLPACFAMCQSLGLMVLPESPKWLIAKGQLENAKLALIQMYGNQYFIRQLDSAFAIDTTTSTTHSSSLLPNKEKFESRGFVTASSTSSLHDMTVSFLDRYQAKDEDYSGLDTEEIEGLEHVIRSSSRSTSDIPLDIREYFLAVRNQQLLQHPANPAGSNHTWNPHLNNTTGLLTTGFKAHGMPTIGIKTNYPTQPSVSMSSISSATSQQSASRSPSTFLRNTFTLTINEQQLMKEYSYIITMIMMIQILSQITGSNVVRNYAPTIFEEHGVSTQTALVYNVILGVIKLLFTILSVVFVEGSGRRQFFLWGIIIVMLGFGFLAIISMFSQDGNISNPELFVVGCALIYAGFGIGYGPMPWILSSEMIPTLIRGRIVAWSLIASNVAQLAVNFAYLPMTSWLSTAGTFGIFTILNLVTFVYVYCFVVETKELVPEEILAKALQSWQQVWHRGGWESHTSLADANDEVQHGDDEGLSGDSKHPIMNRSGVVEEQKGTHNPIASTRKL